MVKWEERSFGFTCRAGPFYYRVETILQSDIYAQVLAGYCILVKNASTVGEAKAWCESHYSDWYNALPVPTPEVGT
jgi:hypothetical protein